MSTLSKLSLALVSSVLLFASPAGAQCPMDDGLGAGPCCTTVTPNLPAFPGFTQDSFEICWRECDVDQFIGCTARFSHLKQLPFGVHCGRYVARLKMFDAAGVKKWKGQMRLTYSRTWVESDATGVTRQVWRFLTNMNLRPLVGGGPCPVPSCAAAFGNRVRFTGYVDYALDCATGAFSNAWMLHHDCDVVDHAPGFPRAGFFHPDRTYTFVGPAAGFAIGPIQPTASGGTSLEAVRRLRLPTGGLNSTFCESEEFIDCGLDTLQELCICSSPNSPRQSVISDLGLGGSCGTSIFTPGGPFLPGYLSSGIGSWTDASTYPGLEILRWSSGGYDYFDPCVGVTRREVFFGVTTLRGDFASTISGIPLPTTFVDQCNAISLRDSRSTIMNVIYASDHVLNLNF